VVTPPADQGVHGGGLTVRVLSRHPTREAADRALLALNASANYDDFQP